MKHLATILISIFFAAYVALAILLVGTLIPIAGYQARIVETGSMTPTIPVGAAVFVHPESSYKTGDVITFQKPGDALPTTHRIVSDDAENGVVYYTTRGDANPAPDQTPTAAEYVIGRVFFSLPYLGYILAFVRTPLGFIVIIGMPFVAVMAEEALKVKNESRRKKEAHAADEAAPQIE